VKKKTRILWIEDGGRNEFVRLAAPFFMSDDLDLTIAENASDGVLLVLREEFQAVLVDIRLPPGEDPLWIELYKSSGKNPISARLGSHVLQSILGSATAKIRLPKPISWIDASKVGVLSIETREEIDDELTCLGITVYREKRVPLADRALLDLARAVLERQ
jgi:hypothetical protein